MEDCNICFQPRENFITASCNHSLCITCFNRLKKTSCPFCRQEYTQEELEQRTNINGNTQNNYIPPQYINNSNISVNISRILVLDDEYPNIQIPFASYYRNMTRKRRKNLTWEEVVLRRKNIKKRMKMKWQRKNGRLNKIRNN